jgi:hypothetical protein
MANLFIVPSQRPQFRSKNLQTVIVHRLESYWAEIPTVNFPAESKPKPPKRKVLESIRQFIPVEFGFLLTVRRRGE